MHDSLRNRNPECSSRARCPLQARSVAQLACASRAQAGTHLQAAREAHARGPRHHVAVAEVRLELRLAHLAACGSPAAARRAGYHCPDAAGAEGDGELEQQADDVVDDGACDKQHGRVGERLVPADGQTDRGSQGRGGGREWRQQHAGGSRGWPCITASAQSGRRESRPTGQGPAPAGFVQGDAVKLL